MKFEKIENKDKARKAAISISTSYGVLAGVDRVILLSAVDALVLPAVEELKLVLEVVVGHRVSSDAVVSSTKKLVAAGYIGEEEGRYSVAELPRHVKKEIEELVEHIKNLPLEEEKQEYALSQGKRNIARTIEAARNLDTFNMRVTLEYSEETVGRYRVTGSYKGKSLDNRATEKGSFVVLLDKYAHIDELRLSVEKVQAGEG